MNVLDALCLECKNVFRWLSGTPRVCDSCLQRDMVNLARLYTLYVPLNNNNGRPIQPGELSWVETEIKNYAGGMTVYQPGIGHWVNQVAKNYRDQMLPVQIVTKADPEAAAWLSRLTARMVTRMQQEKLFYFANLVYLI